MAIPGRAVGYGSTTNKNVFKVTFSRPLSSKVTYEAYDNTLGAGGFPSVDSVLSTTNDIFSLLADTYPCIALHDTTDGGAAATDWFPSTPNSNTSSLNFLKGLVNYVTQHGATLLAAGSITYNLQMNIPATTETNSSMGVDLLFRYSYISTTPTLAFYFNDAEGGTEGTPSWLAFVPNTGQGIVHTRAGIATAGSYLANIPSVENSPEKTQEGWIVTTL